MGKALAQRVNPRVDDVGRRVHIGLANLEVDDVPALTFHGAGTHQHLEGGFSSQPRHSVG